MDKEQLGRLGVWAATCFSPISEVVGLAQDLERWGFGALWIPDALARDQFVELTAVARETTDLKLATGIVSIYSRDSVTMAGCRNALDEVSDGRFVLGLGVSHGEVVSGVRQHDYGRPLHAMRSYLDQMAGVPYNSAPGETKGLVVLAALQDRMIRLAGEQADGAHPFFVTPEHTARARGIMGPGPLLAPEQHVLFIQDASEARRVARQHMALHLGLTNYRNYLLAMGYAEEDFESGGSDRLVDAIVAWGDETAIMKRVEDHWANGADHVCIQPLTQDGEFGIDRQALEALAPS